LPGVASPPACYGLTLGHPTLRQIDQVPKFRVLVEDVFDVKHQCIVFGHRTTVEKLPSPILLVENEQDRQLATVDCTGHESGITASVEHVGIVGTRLSQRPHT
jgi:hypothetical protein